MADFFVRTGDLGDYAAAFSTLAGDATQAVDELMGGLADFADSWGDDAAGQAFFAGYGGPATGILLLTAQMPVQLRAISAAMSQTAAGYAATEATNTELGGGATSA